MAAVSVKRSIRHFFIERKRAVQLSTVVAGGCFYDFVFLNGSLLRVLSEVIAIIH